MNFIGGKCILVISSAKLKPNCFNKFTKFNKYAE